jgi:hypothetical protein
MNSTGRQFANPSPDSLTVWGLAYDEHELIAAQQTAAELVLRLTVLPRETEEDRTLSARMYGAGMDSHNGNFDAADIIAQTAVEGVLERLARRAQDQGGAVYSFPVRDKSQRFPFDSRMFYLTDPPRPHRGGGI